MCIFSVKPLNVTLFSPLKVIYPTTYAQQYITLVDNEGGIRAMTQLSGGTDKANNSDQSKETSQAIGSDQTARLNGLIENHISLEGPLLPILHAIQDDFGFIPDQAVILTAKKLKLSRAEVHGVISFYHYFRTSPAGKNTIQICRAEACQSMGSRQLETDIKKRLKVDFHQTTADGEITLEPVYCLGNCACSPSIRVNNDIHSRMNMQLFEDVLDDIFTVAVEVKS